MVIRELQRSSLNLAITYISMVQSVQ